ncbi:MAG TPA: carboxypeptidase-like regulatory domain-containing protein, partial [Alphaproteobacteria bacterium]|nr:carboxypeptidase-like regulatory domain-containing protein [Alphaproteobacteria bacterium]
MANTQLLAVEDERRIQHNAETDARGHYRFGGLAPAMYSVSVKVAGFAPEMRRVTVVLGETTTVDFELKVSSLTDQVRVETSERTPVVDVEQTAQSSTLGQQYINELPIDRRDYLSFALLMPGVTQTLTIGDSRDLRPLQIPQSGLSFYGSNGRGNNITVDGSNFNGSSQFVMANVSQDAVQEFQINRAD